tara:strand:- start:242 stop:439 length:198 start_codon:yes stop_codon:yes gene_type:complete
MTSTLYPHLLKSVKNVVQDKIDSLNERRSRQLLQLGYLREDDEKSITKEISELSEFLRFYYGEDK